MTNSTATLEPPGVSKPGSRRFFYGWVMAPIGMVMAMCTVPGQSVGVAAFNQSLRTDLQLSASQLAFAYALGTILAACLLPLAGAAIDRDFGERFCSLFRHSAAPAVSSAR